jgi:tRNA threonylcarbamoyl adenosine modification protein YeaZ
MSGRDLLLALETATARTVAALGDRTGRCLAVASVEAPHRHGSMLLEHIDRVLAKADASLDDVGAIVVGTGPGSFTGLRIGMATGKVLAYSLEVPIVGVPTPEALAWWSLSDAPRIDAVWVVLPAGASDVYLARVTRSPGGRPSLADRPGLVPADAALASAVPDGTVITVELAPDALGEAAWARGRDALDRLGEAMVAAGAAALADGRRDDVATLVPTYVALPRGVQRAAEDLAWSPDLR